METTERYRTLQQGEMLNWYRVEQVLGRGGFGVIYLATDTNLDHQVAIKEYVPGALAAQTTDGSSVKTTITADDLHRWGLERFIREARNLVKFKHPNIVRVISVFEQNDSAYMVMEFEKGVELRAYLARPDVASEEQLQALILPIAQGLAEVHRRGFVHRDVKPSNILVREDGSPVLLDFGSARETALLGDSAFTALVSVGYAPLEQYSADSDQQQGPWTDIYALGGVLYFAIGGSDPVDSTRRGAALFNGGRDPLISARLLGEGRYSERFLAAVDWALGFRIAERPQTLDDWLPALLGDAPATIELRRPPEPPPNRTSERMGLPRTGEHLRPERGTQEPPSQAIQREDTMRRAARHSSTASRRAASRTMDRSVSRESVRVHTGMRRMAGRPTHTTRSMQVRADLESRPLSSWRAFDHWLLLVARRIRFRVRRVLRYPVVLLVLVAGVAAVAWYADEQKDARKRAQSEERQSASASTESTQSDTPASTAAADQNDAGSDAPDRATSETGVAADDGDTTGNAGTGEPADSESADDVADTAPVEKPADVSNDTDPVADAAADASARADAEATADTQAGAREDTAVAESDSTAERGADASGRTAPSSAPDTDPDGDTDRKVTEGDRAQSDAMVRDDKTGKTTQNSPDTRDEAPSTEPAKTRTATGNGFRRCRQAADRGCAVCSRSSDQVAEQCRATGCRTRCCRTTCRSQAATGCRASSGRARWSTAGR